MSRLIDNYLRNVDWRRTVRNWPEDVRAIVDGYRAYTSIGHAVQKDAIQNGWSARENKKGKGWRFTFELLESKGKKFFIMMDQGTTGLTGKILSPGEYERDLQAKEKWGRFEAVAFTQPRTERTLGSRGRGKFIFVGASKEYTILYDTLRNDDSYRFGFRTVEKTESPIAAFNDNNGRKKLLEITANLIKPLSSCGTRVIIVEPINELITEIKNGNFIRFINKTWWEIILKHKADIRVIVNGNEQFARIPDDFDISAKESKHIKTWNLKNQVLRASFEEVKIKNLYICHNSKKVQQEDLRGVAIQRDGMKICSLEPRYIGKDIAEKIFGYINFDKETEEALLVDEGIEHYSYDFRRSIPGAIKRFVEDEILRFAKQKLGYGIDSREVKRQQQKNAERRAINAANSFARAMNIGIGPGPVREGTGGERIPKKVRIRMEEIQLPRPGDLRVNYGEHVKNIKICIVNDLDRKIDVQIKLFLRHYDKTILDFFKQDISISSNAVTEPIGPFELELSKESFIDVGRYTITAKVISLSDEDKAYVFDVKTKCFYLEDDPPSRGLFERCEPSEFPDEEPLKYWMGYSEFGSEKGLVLNYNVIHPGYGSVSDTEDDLSEYILRIAGQELCRFDLMQENPVIFKRSEIDEPEEILKQERKVIGELVYKFRLGAL